MSATFNIRRGGKRVKWTFNDLSSPRHEIAGFFSGPVIRPSLFRLELKVTFLHNNSITSNYFELNWLGDAFP